MKRITEPELMNEAKQAAAYANADFEAPHSRVIELFRETFPRWNGKGCVLDLGCGPGDIAMRFATAYPDCIIDGIDGAPAMLDIGRKLLAADSSLQMRVQLHQVLLPRDRAPRDQYDAIICNSLLHHLHDPFVLWDAIRTHAKPGAPVFIVDLMRPDTIQQAGELKRLHIAGEPDILQRDFYNSLLASFTVDEVNEQLASAGLTGLHAKAISDRHLMIWGTLTGHSK